MSHKTNLVRAVRHPSSMAISRVSGKLSAFPQQQDKRHMEQHRRLFRALQLTRKALGDASKITIGERFTFSLHVRDGGTWPHIELRLNDKKQHDEQQCTLKVLASTSSGEGMLHFQLHDGTELGATPLRTDSDMKKLPKALKTAIRSYLDRVGKLALSTRGQEKTADPTPTEPLPTEPLPTAPKEAPQPKQRKSSALDSVDLFEEDNLFGDNLVQAEDDVTPLEPISL